MSPTEYLTSRVTDLEADLETLRPIAERHPVAELKHIGLREIPQAVSEVFAEMKRQRDSLHGALRTLTNAVIELAPYPPDVSVGMVAIVEVAREALAKATGEQVAS